MMDVNDLKEIIEELPGDMVVEFCTFSMYTTEEVNVEVENGKLQISANI